MLYFEMTTETYTRTASGKGWKARPDSVENERVNGTYYQNYVDAIPFFNRGGGHCHGEKAYTAAGYIVTKCTTIDPWKTQKIIARFTPVYMDMEE